MIWGDQVYVGAGRPPIGGNIDTGISTLHAVCRPQALNRGAKPDDPQGPRRQPVMAEDFEPLPITHDFYRCQLGKNLDFVLKCLDFVLKCCILYFK